MESTQVKEKGNGGTPLKLQPLPNNMFDIPTDLNEFWKWWCIIIQPFVKLTPREADVIASFLKHRHELAKVVLDPAVLESQLMGNETRDKVLEDCKITRQHFYVVMSTLRRKNIITENGINRKLIPNIHENEDGTFKFNILIRFKGNE